MWSLRPTQIPEAKKRHNKLYLNMFVMAFKIQETVAFYFLDIKYPSNICIQLCNYIQHTSLMQQSLKMFFSLPHINANSLKVNLAVVA